MIFELSFLAVLLARVECAVSSQSNFSLYAYGTGLNPGLRLFYGDGHAYVGSKAPSFISQAVNITLSEKGDDAQFVATPERTVGWAAQPTMLVDMDTNSFDPVGFTWGNETLDNSSSTVGFGIYGGWAFHRNDEGTIEMKFYATPTNESDVYLVKWNGGETKSVDGISISLRTQAPVVITS
ncbi:hypothetical protein CC78DRAFT_577078 [Lojkania enalia]|uniref:Uncharacterized protein n=1 Tax=Lojkania enalia TaxID=147567 RepID=A0A9P4KDT1_9PLEO|nr:hypothetical protein CC78DRAFT_577078 [Didymosphaeria enalia]